MHDMNLAIARTVNGFYQRRGKAIEDRFRSPVICDYSYCLSTIQYIWLNPVKAKMIAIKDMQDYRYCSLFYRYRGLQDPLADSYAELKTLTGFDVLQRSRSEQDFARNQLNALKSKARNQCEKLIESIFDHAHTIGNPEAIKARLTILKKYDSSWTRSEIIIAFLYPAAKAGMVRLCPPNMIIETKSFNQAKIENYWPKPS